MFNLVWIIIFFFSQFKKVAHAYLFVSLLRNIFYSSLVIHVYYLYHPCLCLYLILSISISDTIGTYLGCLSTNKRKTEPAFDGIDVNQSNILSNAGKNVLIKYNLFGIS